MRARTAPRPPAAGFVGVVVLASGDTAGAEVGLAALCYGIAANLIKRYLADLPATAVASGTLLCSALMVVPLFGVAWAWLFLGEPVTPTMAVSGALILGSVLVSQRRAAVAPKPALNLPAGPYTPVPRCKA